MLTFYGFKDAIGLKNNIARNMIYQESAVCNTIRLKTLYKLYVYCNLCECKIISILNSQVFSQVFLSFKLPSNIKSIYIQLLRDRLH